jgi:SAM-dependent methyltransferase
MATIKIADTVPPHVAPTHKTLPRRDTPDFDPLAKVYRWLEYLSFGPMLERCRFHFLSSCGKARHALVLGDGDGRFTARLLAMNRTVQVDAIDSSPAMLAELRRRVLHSAPNAESRLRTVHADLRDFTPERCDYDLMASHFFLDCLTDDEVSAMVERILPHLSPNATWLISEFAIPAKGVRRAAARLLIRFLYFAFNKMTHLRVQQIPDYSLVMALHGFRRREQVRFLGGLLMTELWHRQDR